MMATKRPVLTGTKDTVGRGIRASNHHVAGKTGTAPTMVEARIMRDRPDRSADDCDLDQFEYAGTNIGVGRVERQA